MKKGLSSLILSLDRVAFAKEAGLVLDPWQEQFVSSEHKRVLLNCSRQSGKSTCSAIIAVHEALYQDKSTILLLSPSQRQSSELFRKCLDVYKALDKPIDSEAESALRLELENGSRIVALPGKGDNLRGFSSINLIICDEASRVPEDLYVSFKPMLAVSNGRLICPSTPNGMSNWWASAWHDEGDTWQRFRVPATECPRIPPSFLAEERRVLGPSRFGQEYMCEFSSDINAVFSEELLSRIISEEEHAWSVEPASWSPQVQMREINAWNIKQKAKHPDMTPWGIPYQSSVIYQQD